MKYLNECNYIIKILKSVINGSALADSNEELDWDDLYMIAEKQWWLLFWFEPIKAMKLRNQKKTKGGR